MSIKPEDLDIAPFLLRLLTQPNEASARRLMGALGIGVTSDAVPEGVLNLYYTSARVVAAAAAAGFATAGYVDGKVIDSIADADTTHAPSRNAVFDALTLKQNAITDSGWIAPTLLNSWVDFGGGYLASGYRKIGSIVYLRGTIKSGTATTGTPVMLLPAGYRPTAQATFATPNPNSPTNDTRVEVKADGNVIISGPVSNTYLGLDGIAFFTD